MCSLEREIAKHKEQYRVTFDQLAEKERELRARDAEFEESRAQSKQRESAMDSVLEKQRQLCSEQKKALIESTSKLSVATAETKVARANLRECQIDKAVCEERLESNLKLVG